MTTPFKLHNSVAVITGAASGIGAALAAELAQRGCHLALADRDDQGLQALVRRLLSTATNAQIHISTHLLDVTDRTAIAAFPDAVVGRHGSVNLLFNNAGIASMGTFIEQSEDEFDAVLNVNLWGVIRMTRAFLPLLKREQEAHIVNLSSVFGLVAPAGQAAYATSKFGVRGFSEALRHELANTGVRVMAVHPGGIRTAIAANARPAAVLDPAFKAQQIQRFDTMARTTAEQAAQVIVLGVEQRKKRVLIGGDAKFLDWLQRLLPVGYWGVMVRLLGEKHH